MTFALINNSIRTAANPNGIASSSPRLRGTSYLGHAVPNESTPAGLRPAADRDGATPSGLRSNTSRFPGIGRAAQLRASSRNPVGILRRRRDGLPKVGARVAQSGTLLYRRLAVCVRARPVSASSKRRAFCQMPFGDTVPIKSGSALRAHVAHPPGWSVSAADTLRLYVEVVCGGDRRFPFDIESGVAAALCHRTPQLEGTRKRHKLRKTSAL